MPRRPMSSRQALPNRIVQERKNDRDRACRLIQRSYDHRTPTIRSGAVRPSNTTTTNLPLQVRAFLRSQYQSLDRTAPHTSIRHKRSRLSNPRALFYNVMNLRSR